MYYINSAPTENGNYGNPRSNGDGYKLPSALLQDYISTMGFATLTVEDNTVVSVEPNEEAYNNYMDTHPVIITTPSEMREKAYNDNAIIDWYEKHITVTEAAQLWQYYAAEGNEDKTSELSALIAEAKSKIREEYPDERTENNEQN